VATCEIDFAHHSAAQKAAIVGSDNLTDKFVAGHSRKPVITTQQLQIGVADATGQQPYRCKAFGASGTADITNLHAPAFDVDSQHETSIVRGCVTYGAGRSLFFFDGPPPEKVPNGTARDLNMRIHINEIGRCKSIPCAVRKEVEQDGPLQTDIAVNENIEDEVHQRPNPVPNQQRPGTEQKQQKENGHKFCRMQRKHKLLWAE
jgi:hypothetical protein